MLYPTSVRVRCVAIEAMPRSCLPNVFLVVSIAVYIIVFFSAYSGEVGILESGSNSQTALIAGIIRDSGESAAMQRQWHSTCIRSSLQMFWEAYDMY